jgi:hypothetical protein
MTVRAAIRRELRVAFSRRAQPVWFRVVKWTVLLSLAVLLWPSPYFWWFIGGATAIGLAVHLVWRCGTRGWTRPWCGWSDVETALGADAADRGVER